MTDILISNSVDVDKLPESMVCKTIYQKWKLVYDPKTVSGGVVFIQGFVDVPEKYPKGPVPKIERHDFDDKIEISQSFVDSWLNEGQADPEQLLWLLLRGQDWIDEDCIITKPDENERRDDLLRMVIPGCCACGSPTDAMNSLMKVFTAFNYHPIGRDPAMKLNENGSHLLIAYMIDAQNRFITHGSGIGGSWFDADGIIFVLLGLMLGYGHDDAN